MRLAAGALRRRLRIRLANDWDNRKEEHLLAHCMLICWLVVTAIGRVAVNSRAKLKFTCQRGAVEVL